MRNVAEKELQINLHAILTRAQSERIIISRGGKPCAVLVGIEDYDAEDLRLASSADFWRMIRQRRAAGTSVPLEDVEARLGITSGKPAGKRAAGRKGAQVLVSPVCGERGCPDQTEPARLLRRPPTTRATRTRRRLADRSRAGTAPDRPRSGKNKRKV